MFVSNNQFVVIYKPIFVCMFISATATFLVAFVNNICAMFTPPFQRQRILPKKWQSQIAWPWLIQWNALSSSVNMSHPIIFFIKCVCTDKRGALCRHWHKWHSNCNSSLVRLCYKYVFWVECVTMERLKSLSKSGHEDAGAAVDSAGVEITLTSSGNRF